MHTKGYILLWPLAGLVSRPLAHLLLALGTDLGTSSLQHLLEHQMEPPQQGPSPEGSPVSLEGLAGVDSCRS